jgi:hypothetical protein
VIPEIGGIRAIARATGHSKNTICRRFEIGGTHPKEVTTYFLRNLYLKKVEFDKYGHKCSLKELLMFRVPVQ